MRLEDEEFTTETQRAQRTQRRAACPPLAREFILCDLCVLCASVVHLQRRITGTPADDRRAAWRPTMKQYIVRRVGYSLLSLFLLSLAIFLFVRVTGDPATLFVEPGASPDDIEQVRHRFGLDQPLWVQYWQFILSFVHGDLGQSFYYRTPVLDLYLERLPNSLVLAGVAMAFSLL